MITDRTTTLRPFVNPDPLPPWPSAPYGPMAKPYHPCYTNVNPAEEAGKYTAEQVYFRRVTLIYDWLPPGREAESWFRRVPYRLERANVEDSWIVKYFEFRAGIAPLAQLGFIGDLWVSWGAGDPSVWFKVEEMKWERWGGCASSVRGQMNAKHPFLDNAYLWFSPRDFFFVGKLPDSKLSLRWDRLPRIRRIAPTTRMIDPDSNTPPKKVPVNPVILPSMRTIVRTLCPNMVQFRPAPPTTTPVADRRDGHDGGTPVPSTSKVRVEDRRKRLPTEEIDTGDAEFDWDWWGSSDGEAEDERTLVESSQSQLLNPTPTPRPTTPPRDSRYHPYRLTPPPTTPFSKFKPPARYTKGTHGQNTSLNDPFNTPVSSFPSVSSTAVNTTTPAPRLTSEPIDPSFTDDDNKEIAASQESEILQVEGPHLQRLSQRMLEEIVRILQEDGHIQSGVWAVVLSEACEAGEDLTTGLSIPTLDLGTRTLLKIRRLLRQDGFTKHGMLVLNVDHPGDDGYDKRWMEEIRAWF